MSLNLRFRPPVTADDLLACHCCGLIQRTPPDVGDAPLACHRCGTSIQSPTPRRVSASRTAAASLGAFVLFWPAVLLPILRIERLGRVSEQSILGGVAELFRHRSYFVGTIVVLFSVVFPLTKLTLLFELSCLNWLGRRHQATTLRWMEHAGRWSMMDVMLLAFLVMLVKLGGLVEFSFGPAVIAFTGCVAMSMLASIVFDPHSIWNE